MVPFKNVHTVSYNGSVKGGSSVAITGHTIVQAESIEYAKYCPFLGINGTLEVAEVVQM